jgi:hypothetical protein
MLKEFLSGKLPLKKPVKKENVFSRVKVKKK